MQNSVLDLFAGSGGLSLGLENAGFKVIGAIEIDQWAADTYRTNLTSPVTQVDLTLYSDRELKKNFSGVDFVVGGPPCQGFSVSGTRQFGINNPKNRLVHEFVRAVRILRPRAFILENVRGLVSAQFPNQTKVLELVLHDLSDIGYKIHFKTLQAADYGIPQFRSRVIVLGTLEAVEDPFPEQTHSRRGINGLKPYLGAWDAISDLPKLIDNRGVDGKQDYETSAENEFQKLARKRSSGVFNHVAMKHSQRIIERFSSIPAGGKGYHIGRSGLEESIVTVYKSNNQRLVASEPSLCITANFQSNYIHPCHNRNLTAREAARIQTFPDSYVFQGKRTLMSSKLLVKEGREEENFLSQYNQIGNAVPPRLAALIGENLLAAINKLSLEDRKRA